MKPDINATNMASIINDAFLDCLYKEDEDTRGHIKVEGVVRNFGFHPDRLETKRDLIGEALKQLPEVFKKGYSFLGLCQTKNGEQWGEHIHAEQLVALAIGLGLMSYCFPRDMWAMLPGGVPYVQINAKKGNA